MYEEILDEYDILDKQDLNDIYTKDVFEDPEFYGISFDEYEQILIDRELQENPNAYDMGSVYDDMDPEMKTKL